ncbi:hypothetical protein B0T17DRAFT_128520 [Bombardia bombarda]|uniref:SWR1-complex protein 3 domain-containing protein n=1 Tax=Bombardia bombarda TaxID=252184 RepID=A0AA39U121_9PEZI|nr:hypothetical protein B0T17DRAFT_128520 [Bombardia bombarda]
MPAEKKRKLPARAAARVEHIAKKRTLTPPQRSATPATPAAPAPEPERAPTEEPPPPLPKSIAPGKPLPTVDTPQPDDLPNKDHQSVSESGVLAESLARSRQRWVTEGIFEKFWSKPVKKKGVLIEEPNNPPKESMTKLGQVTITVEPHVFEATMYAVKDPKPPQPPPPPTTVRPVVQYGPPNGVMPPPPTPKPTPPPTIVSTPVVGTPQPQTPAQAQPPSQAPAQLPSQAPAQTPTQPQTTPSLAPQINTQHPNPPAVQDVARPAPAVAPTMPRPPVASPRGMESVLSPITVPPPVQRPPVPAQAVAAQPAASHHLIQHTTPMVVPVPPVRPPGTHVASTTAKSPVNGNSAAPGKPGTGTDPIILTLAEKAGEDPQLRDLMKRVAQGDAAKHELERFQAIIDAITAESKRKGNPVGPSADRLIVDGKTVRYFADEVRAILDIVLSSNPKQTSGDLRPPAGSDALVVLLVKTALDDMKTRDMVRRIAENKPQFSDATDLKAVLDRLRGKLAKDTKEQLKTQSPAPAPAAAAATPKANGVSNGHKASPATASPAVTQQPPAAQQALRSKGPPPPPKPDISAVVFEFAGGTGDRYLFPKFSMLETVLVGAGQQQVICSFLIVRKGSKSEYPVVDPELDYYQPVTIRLFTSAGKHLENLARVVAPPEEVKQYMDDVMDRMTRAEYILLAMRLPRREKDEAGEEKEKENQTNGVAAAKQAEAVESVQTPTQTQTPKPQPTVLWTATRPGKPEIREATRPRFNKTDVEDKQYQSFISTVTRKEVKEV